MSLDALRSSHVSDSAGPSGLGGPGQQHKPNWRELCQGSLGTLRVG